MVPCSRMLPPGHAYAPELRFSAIDLRYDLSYSYVRVFIVRIFYTLKGSRPYRHMVDRSRRRYSDADTVSIETTSYVEKL